MVNVRNRVVGTGKTGIAGPYRYRSQQPKFCPRIEPNSSMAHHI